MLGREVDANGLPQVEVYVTKGARKLLTSAATDHTVQIGDWGLELWLVPQLSGSATLEWSDKLWCRDSTAYW